MSAPKPREHGTHTGYRQHVKYRDPACRPCRDALAGYMRNFRKTNLGYRAQNAARHRALERLAQGVPGALPGDPRRGAHPRVRARRRSQGIGSIGRNWCAMKQIKRVHSIASRLADGGGGERKPRLVDFFCCAGGASMGYHRAGFEVVGVDKEPQPNYPFEFIQADAIGLLSDPAFMNQFDAGAGSPPCQPDSKMTNCRPGLAETYQRLIEPTRALLTEWGRPWVIENVDGSGLPAQGDLLGANGLLLCGAMFGRELYRHRLFESSFPIPPPNHPRHLKPASKAGHWKPGTVISVEGHCSPIALAREVMDIDWMPRDQLAESIPPYYTEYIGSHLLKALRATEYHKPQTAA